jgi:cation/acetate symporter
VQAAEKALAAVPADEEAAKTAWTAPRPPPMVGTGPLAGMPRHAQQFAGDPER